MAEFEQDSAEDFSFDETICPPGAEPYSIVWGDEPHEGEFVDVGDGGWPGPDPVRRLSFLEQLGYLTPTIDGAQFVTRAGCEAAAEAMLDRLRGVA